MNHRTGLVALALAAVLLGVAVAAPPQMDSSDAIVRLEVARSMWQRGTIALEAPPNDPEMAPVGADGRYFGLFPLGQSMIFVPLDAVAYAATVRFGDSATFLRGVLVAGVYLILSNLCLGWVLLALMRRAGLSTRSAALGLVVAFLATQWLVWGRSTQEETAAASLLGLGVLCWWRTRPTIRGALLAGTVLGLLANMRYNAVFAALSIVAWAFCSMPTRTWFRFWLVALLAMLPWLALAALYNWARFGSIASTGYDVLEARGMLPPFEFKPMVLLELAVGLDYGLVWFWPILGFSLSAGRFRPALICLTLGLVAHSLLLATYSSSPGGQGCTGPRYLFHQLVLVLPIAYVGIRRLWLGKRFRWLVIAVLIGSASVQMSSALLIGNLETMQFQARQAAGLETWPSAYLPQRVSNLGRLADGTLLDYGWPDALGERVENLRRESYVTASRPNLLPWRLHGIRASIHADFRLRWLMTGIWLCACLCALACWARLVRACRDRKAVKF